MLVSSSRNQCNPRTVGGVRTPQTSFVESHPPSSSKVSDKKRPQRRLRVEVRGVNKEYVYNTITSVVARGLGSRSFHCAPTEGSKVKPVQGAEGGVFSSFTTRRLLWSGVPSLSLWSYLSLCYFPGSEPSSARRSSSGISSCSFSGNL